jgi:hypothetical protein
MPTLKEELLQRDVEAFFEARADLMAGVSDLTDEALSQALLRFVQALRASGETISDERFKALLAEYAATLRIQHKAARDLDATRYNGLIVRSACRSGLVTDLTEGAVGEMRAGAVRDLASQIDKALTAAFEVPGE